MSDMTLRVRGLDTLLFRDGRPFGAEAGARADTLPVPMPSTLAGFLRTLAGYARGCASAAEWADLSASVAIRGPLLCREDEPILPAPADVLVPRRGGGGDDGGAIGDPIPLRPWSAAALGQAGTDIPGGMRPMRITADAKPARGYGHWTWANVERWLRGDLPGTADLVPDLAPLVDERVHIQMDHERGAAAEHALFSTRMVAFERREADEHGAPTVEYSLLCRAAGLTKADVARGAGTLGGESRLALVAGAEPDAWPRCPAELARAVAGARRVRLLLATPAVFTHGWKPGWIDRTTREGAPPGPNGKPLGVRLRLVAAAVPRRQPLSGWDLTHGGPKPLRYCAPAGAVYFFEKVDGDAACLATEGEEGGWLAPVSDLEETSVPGRRRANNRDDGFGLALWGAWNEEE
ncbi:MAG: type III-B CRISPR module-associated protein Cmr3 [Chthonomonadales bacterium]|nr:type III-B CRISPR module-associated protein Cmr3 [Chthonomonadales bacterium]